MSLLIHKLSLSFAQPAGWLNIIQDLSLSLLPGRTVGLVGESGCGKSLTALSILRLLPPHAGYGGDAEIFLDDVDILNVESRQMCIRDSVIFVEKEYQWCFKNPWRH